MQIQVNAGNGMQATEALERWANDFLVEQLARFGEDITRIELQLADEHRTRAGADDKRCLLEARLAGRAEPVVAEHRAEDQNQAIRGATQKLLHALDHVLGKLDRREHRDRETIRRAADGVL